jgi:thiamine-phosphate diphosphorylase
MPLIDVPTIHAVTDPRILELPEFLSRADAVFRALGTSGAVHLRAPGIGASRLYRMACYLKELEAVTGCRLIVNDRADVAGTCEAWGVQLGQRSLSPPEARLAAPRAKMGVSVHSAEEARIAIGQRADWLMAGSIHETPSHPGVRPQGLSIIRETASLGVPVIAIGGVLPVHVAALKDAGAHGVAAIRGIWESPDPGAAARAYLQKS